MKVTDGGADRVVATGSPITRPNVREEDKLPHVPSANPATITKTK